MPKSAFLSPALFTLTFMATGHESEAELLSERDQRVLDFEGSWWLYPEPKDRAVSEYLGMSATRYYQVLRRLADEPAALAYAPLTVRRMRRIRRNRRAQIAAATVSDGDRAT
jgi:hypothetical protein